MRDSQGEGRAYATNCKPWKELAKDLNLRVKLRDLQVRRPKGWPGPEKFGLGV